MPQALRVKAVNGMSSRGHQLANAVGIRGKKAYVALLLIVLSLVALYLIITSPASNGTVNILEGSYSFDALLNLTISTVGISQLSLILGATFTLLAFFTAIPSSGGFGSVGARVAGLYLFQNTFFYAFALLLLVSPVSFLGALPYVILPLLGMTWSSEHTKHDLTYAEYEQSKSGRIGPTSEFTASRFLSTNVLLITIIVENFYLIKFNPSLALFGWVLIFYSFFFSLLQVAYSYGFVFQAINAKKVQITTTDKESLEGYLVGKGEDHFIIRTPDQNLLLPVGSVSKVVLVEKKQEKPSTSVA